MLARAVAILTRHQSDPCLFDRVVRGIFAYGSPQMQVIADARLIATEAHRHDKRHDGEEYIRHPEFVAVIAMEYLGVTDEIEIGGCLLHDVCEDHAVEWPIYRLREKVGKEMAEAVDWVNMRRFDHMEDTGEAHRLYFHNLLNVAPLRSVRIKLCDQFHNGLTPWNLADKGWVSHKVHDLREYYIPMAKKFGILYQELIQVSEALEKGTCLLSARSLCQSVPVVGVKEEQHHC